MFSPGENLKAQTAAPAPSKAIPPVAIAATLPKHPTVAAAIVPKQKKQLLFFIGVGAAIAAMLP